MSTSTNCICGRPQEMFRVIHITGYGSETEAKVCSRNYTSSFEASEHCRILRTPPLSGWYKIQEYNFNKGIWRSLRGV